MRPLYYRLTAHLVAVPCPDLLEWGEWFERCDSRVAISECEAYKVSTVFTGVDLALGRCGDPLLFETLVFHRDGRLGPVQRYSTWAEAVAGHERIRSMMAREYADAAAASRATV